MSENEFKDAVRFFRKQKPEDIRKRAFLEYTDEFLLSVADELIASRKHDHYVAIIEAVLHSPEHADDLLNYGELYFEVIGNVVPFRTWRDNVATAYAWFTYGVRHASWGDVEDSLVSLILEYLAREDQASIEQGLRLLSRSARAYSFSFDWGVEIVGFLLEDEKTEGLGENILRLWTQRLHEAGREATAEEIQELLEDGENTKPSHAIEVDPALVDELVENLMSLTDSDEFSGEGSSFSFSIRPPLDALFEKEPDDAWIDQLAPQAEILIPEFIYLGLSHLTADLPAADRAVRVLQRWQKEGIAPLDELAPWLDRAQGNWRRLLTDRIGKVGFLTIEELKALASDTQVNTSLRIDAITALIDIAQRMPEIREEVESFLRFLLTRPESRELPQEENFLAGLIGEILTANWRTLLPEIEAAFRDDVVSPEIILPEDVEMEWGVKLDIPNPLPPRKGGEYLLLRCKQCGRMRHHFVQRVMLDLGTLDKSIAGVPVKYDPFIMDHEIVCPKCGARDAYEVPPLQATRLLSLAHPDVEPDEDDDSLAALLHKAVIASGGEVKVFPVRTVGMRGMKEFHPLELRDIYLKRVQKNPKDAANYVALANIYKSIFRDEQALEMARKAYELAPDDPEIILLLAMGEHDAGDKDVAKALYGRLIDLAAKDIRWSYDWVLLQELITIAQEGLKALRQGRPSPWRDGSSMTREPQKPKRSASRRLPRRKKKKKKKKR